MRVDLVNMNLRSAEAPALPPRERSLLVAAILAEGYLRLLVNRKSKCGPLGQLGGNGASDCPSERLDSPGNKTDQLGAG
jgi:hypothetical protein